MKILIVEDDPVSKRLLQSRLEKWGHQVLTASNGFEALARLENESCPIVITDWMMPRMDGLELIRHLRSSETVGYVYIILLTAKQHKEDLVLAMEAGADDFVTKPFDKDELRVRLRAGERIIELEQKLADQNQQLTRNNKRMKRDLETAGRIQKSLLPIEQPNTPGIQYAWLFQPCEELAGDILNVFELDESHVGMYVLDVSGHGLSAALLSVTLSRILSPGPVNSSILKQQSGTKNHNSITPPAEVARHLNRRFPLNMETGQFFTLMYGILNIKTLEFSYISAGHPDIIHYSKEKDPRIIKTPGYPIGVSENSTFKEHRLSLASGDRIYVYSDGITEARNDRNEFFGETHLLGNLKAGRNLDLSKSLQNLLSDLTTWQGGAHFEDDMSVLAFEIE